MKAAVLRAIDANRRPMPGREPGITDLRLYLEERPATYAALVDRARIGREWHEVVGPNGEHVWTRWPLVVRMSVEGKAEDPEAVCHVAQEGDGPWRAYVLGQELDESFLTPEEARHAADLRASDTYGWALLGGAS
jgi:hypothetical protein